MEQKVAVGLPIFDEVHNREVKDLWREERKAFAFNKAYVSVNEAELFRRAGLTKDFALPELLPPPTKDAQAFLIKHSSDAMFKFINPFLDEERSRALCRKIDYSLGLYKRRAFNALIVQEDYSARVRLDRLCEGWKKNTPFRGR